MRDGCAIWGSYNQNGPYIQTRHIDNDIIQVGAHGYNKRFYMSYYNYDSDIWSPEHEILTENDVTGNYILNRLKGRLYTSISDSETNYAYVTAIESCDGVAARYRLQMCTNGDVAIYKSTDNGSNWAVVKILN